MMRRHAVYVEFTIDPHPGVESLDEAREYLKRHLKPLMEMREPLHPGSVNVLTRQVIAHYHIIGLREVQEWD